MSSRNPLQRAFVLTLGVLLLAGCGGAPAEPTATPTPIPPTATPTPIPPTATPTPVPPTPTPTPIPEHAAVQTVRAFHEAINAIEPAEGKLTDEGGVKIGAGLSALAGLLEEYTTETGVPFPPSAMMSAISMGMVRLSNMEYELVSETTECAVVKATGEMTIGEEATDLDEEYIVVKREEEWLINMRADSCD